jgi:hypothetical protein
MRRLRLAALLLVALLGSGCFVLDELDAGNEIMDSHSATRNKNAKAAAEKAAAEKQGEPQDPKERQKTWWDSATSLSSADQAPKEDPHIRCRIEKSERFMRQSDCLTQGGAVL